MKNTQKTILKWLIIAAAYVFIACIFSNSFDYDLGWHLRFGKEFWETKQFPYLDTYTWAHYGQAWTNHEWGGDILFWPIYANFSYLALILLVALAPLAACLIVLKIFQRKITIAGAVLTFISLWSIQHILTMRLAMLAPLFLAILWYFLEKIPKQKNYYLWPLLLWLWSILHGSWILGFIVISVYIAGNIINLAAKKYLPKYHRPDLWGIKDIRNAVIWTLVSAGVILINPYGWHLWSEVINYFSLAYYKAHTLEWIPSYTYPVYWKPLVIAAISIPLVVLGFKNRKITWPQFILYTGLWYAAWKYKRQAILFVLICLPLFALYWEEIKRKLSEKFSLKAVYFFPIAAALLLTANYFLKTDWTLDVWQNKRLLAANTMPVEAIEFLKEKTAGQKTFIFNEFGWGGYMNWALPEALVYFDGRGTATWMQDEKESMMERYYKIKYEAGGLAELKASPVDYVILSKISVAYPRPNKFNRMIFSQKDFDKIFSPELPQLSKMLERSDKWDIIYEDAISKVWERQK